MSLSQLTFQLLPLKFRCSSFNFHWLLFSRSVKIKIFTLLSNNWNTTSAAGFITSYLHETRNEISSHYEKKFSFRGGWNETAHYMTVNLVWFEKYIRMGRCFLSDRFTRLRLELSHLRKHKFKYNFQNCLNPLCSCGSSNELTSHFLLHCPIFNDKRHTLLSTLNTIDCKILEWSDSYLTQTFLYGCTSFDTETNAFVLNATIDLILSTERFEEPLFKKKNPCFSYAIL